MYQQPYPFVWSLFLLGRLVTALHPVRIAWYWTRFPQDVEKIWLRVLERLPKVKSVSRSILAHVHGDDSYYSMLVLVAFALKVQIVGYSVFAAFPARV